MNPEKRKYTNADEVYKRLEQYFAAHTHAMGDRVPPERDLATGLGVNRTTLRSAMHRMVKEGVLERHVGRGTFYKASPSSILENYRPVNMECSPAELLELRRLIEPALASMAAVQADGEPSTRIGQYAARLHEAASGAQLTLDLELQALLVESLRNRLLVQLCELIAQIRRRFQSRPGAGLGFDDDGRWRAHQQAICRAVLLRDGKGAAQAVEGKLAELLAQLNGS